MDNEETIIIACMGAMIGAWYLLRKRRRKVRSCKVRKINRNRKTLGFYKSTFLPMKENDLRQFFKYTRMSVCTFEKLLSLITPHLVRKQLPDSVCPEERLALTLHYLSQGTSMQSIAWSYQLGHTTVHKIIKEVTVILWDVLAPLYLRVPSSREQWMEISNGFYTKCNFPNCVGALDGKHINIQAPAHSGSQFFNYKKCFSTVLLASCDAEYNFILVDIGAYGSQSDGGIFRQSTFGTALDLQQMNLPAPSELPGSDTKTPYVFVADEAFPLKPYIMRPFPGKQLSESKRIFNYRLSSARRTIENTFGILVARWRILKQTICADVNNIDNFIKALVCLHNFVKKENSNLYCPIGYTDSDIRPGDWRLETEELQSVGRLSSNNAPRATVNLRNTFANYFISPEGEVPWQYDHVRRGREPCSFY